MCVCAKCWTGNGHVLNCIAQKGKQAPFAPIYANMILAVIRNHHITIIYYSRLEKSKIEPIVKCKLHEQAWFDLVTASIFLANSNAIARWSSVSGMPCDLVRGSRWFSMPNLSQCDHTWSSLQNDSEQAEWTDEQERQREGEKQTERNCRKKRMERKGAGTLRRYFQLDLWSKPLMPAYSLAWKRIPKRYLNFPNAPRKRAKRRTILRHSGNTSFLRWLSRGNGCR